MNLHEYQSKKLLADYGVPVPPGHPARTADEAIGHARALGGEAWMVKAQVHAGGRGKAGGVKMAKSLDEVGSLAEQMLGTRLVTKQTTADGQPIGEVLVEATSRIGHEYYLSMLVDRTARQVAIIASAAGGMDIEEVAEKEPDKIVTSFVDPAAGLQPYQVRRIGFAFGLDGKQMKQLNGILSGLYRLFTEKDLSMLELNPLCTTADGDLLALDAKVNLDDNALYRHADLEGLRDESQEDEKECRARRFDLNYITLDGNIGRRRRHRRREGLGGLQADRLGRQGEGDPGEHLRRHRALRPDRRGHHQGGQGGRREHAGGRAPGRDQRRPGPRHAREERAVGHRRGLAGGRRGQGRGGGGLRSEGS